MKNYDFDRETVRRGSGSLKWDLEPDTHPMWVADMDFEVAPEIKRAIVERAEHGIFGYTLTGDALFGAIQGFYKRRHGWDIDREDMIFSAGVVATISSAVRKLTTPAEKVLLQAPVYNIFYNCILNNGRQVVSSDLVYENGRYSIDFEDLEEKLSDPQLTLFILCNPHNPTGNVWSAWELRRIGELCKKYSVTVISDEIHGEFTSPKCSYTPFATASEACRDISVVCVSASKSFNLAGIHGSCVIVSNPLLRARTWRALNTDEVAEPNVFAPVALTAAFSECDGWLDDMLDYVLANKEYAGEYIEKNIPVLKCPQSNATYLLWVDATELGIDSPELCERLKREVGLYVSDGLEYGECARYFIRINMATQRSRVELGMKLLKEGIEKIINEKEVK